MKRIACVLGLSGALLLGGISPSFATAGTPYLNADQKIPKSTVAYQFPITEQKMPTNPPTSTWSNIKDVSNGLKFTGAVPVIIQVVKALVPLGWAGALGLLLP